jgi:predicted membrane-bound spermidine synthase
MQLSRKWSLQGYHEHMALPARKNLNLEKARVLILGGGDGLAASVLLEHFEKDEVHIVDFDCDLLREFREQEILKDLSRHVWDHPQLKTECADAFWYLQQPSQKEAWDLILVDFPHGVGSAAYAKVETWNFFLDLRNALRSNGRVVLHHEEYKSEARECVQRTLDHAGFTTSSSEVYGMAMIEGKKNSPTEVPRLNGIGAQEKTTDLGLIEGLKAGKIQTLFHLPCETPTDLNRIWTGTEFKKIEKPHSTITASL